MSEQSPIQKIFFGSPATGKSHWIEREIIGNQLQIRQSADVIKTVFHPEYGYGDFMGKLVPYTKEGKVSYNFFEGHLIKALARAYKNILENPEKPNNVALVIDEINRGNSAAIFGTIFQLLDRQADGWSAYSVTITELEMLKILELVNPKVIPNADGIFHIKLEGIGNYDYSISEKYKNLLYFDLQNRKIKLPPNLSILASMNISDHSIYFMDNAFKRRWEWEFIDIKNNKDKEVYTWKIHINNQEYDWVTFIDQLNLFIKSKHEQIRNIEDKQVGYRFINKAIIKEEDLKNKLLFFVWDSVFSHNKKILSEFLGEQVLVFGDFAQNVEKFTEKIMTFSKK